jgi:hypothetical protein
VQDAKAWYQATGLHLRERDCDPPLLRATPETKGFHVALQQRVKERSTSPQLQRLKREECELKCLQANTDTSIVQQRAQLQKFRELQRDYRHTCASRREKLQNEYDDLDKLVERSFKLKLEGLQADVQLKHNAHLKRMREITAQLVALGDASVYLPRAGAALDAAVREDPNVVAAHHAQRVLDVSSPEVELREAESTLNAAEQRMLTCGAPSPTEVSVEDECQRVLHQ